MEYFTDRLTVKLIPQLGGVQGIAYGGKEGNCQNHGDDSVDRGGEQLSTYIQEGDIDFVSLDKEIHDKALSNIKDNVSQGARHAGDDVPNGFFAFAVAVVGNDGADKSQQEFKTEGEGGIGQVIGIHNQIIQKGTDARSQSSADGTADQTGQQAEGISNMNAGDPSDKAHRKGQTGPHINKGGHEGNYDNLIYVETIFSFD